MCLGATRLEGNGIRKGKWLRAKQSAMEDVFHSIPILFGTGIVKEMERCIRVIGFVLVKNERVRLAL